MAINNEKVTKLKLRAKERNSTSIRINRPKATSQKGVNIDFVIADILGTLSHTNCRTDTLTQ